MDRQCVDDLSVEAKTLVEGIKESQVTVYLLLVLAYTENDPLHPNQLELFSTDDLNFLKKHILIIAGRNKCS